jgi:hypothetical protein
VQLPSIRDKAERRPEFRDKVTAAVVKPGGASSLSDRDASIICYKVATELRVLCVPYFESVVNWFTVPFTPSLVPSGRVESTV